MLGAANKSHTDRTMKAVIMAGGAGTRGRPYTDNIPKPMTRVAGRPMIEHIVRYISASRSIDGIVIVTDLKGMGGQIRNYLQDLRVACPVTFVQNASAGTAGDLLCAKSKLGGSRFMLWFSDNLCAVDIDTMIAAHKVAGRTACVAVRSWRKEETGFVRTDGILVSEFVEKPTVALEMQECLGIYVLDSAILAKIPRRASRKVDLSYDILSPLASSQQLSAYDIGRAGWLDVESPVILERNAQLVSEILAQMGRRARTMRAGRATARRRRSR